MANFHEMSCLIELISALSVFYTKNRAVPKRTAHKISTKEVNFIFLGSVVTPIPTFHLLDP